MSERTLDTVISESYLSRLQQSFFGYLAVEGAGLTALLLYAGTEYGSKPAMMAGALSAAGSIQAIKVSARHFVDVERAAMEFPDMVIASVQEPGKA